MCLAELDLQTGDLRSLLDLQSHRSIADLASVAEGEVTVRSLDDTLYVHSTGLRVLLAPERGEDGEDIGASAARQILGALKFQYDIVICDVGSVMTEAGAVAVEMASNVLIVTTPDVPAIRAANRLLRLWERLQIDTPARILLNRTSREHEIQPDFARRVLQAPVLDTTLPSGFRDLEEPLNTGHPERLEQGVDPSRAGGGGGGDRGRPGGGPAPAPAAAPRGARRDRPDDDRDARDAADRPHRGPRPHPDAVRRLHVDGDQPGRPRRRARVGGRRQQGLVDRRGQGPAAQELARRRQGRRAQGRAASASPSPSTCPPCSRCRTASRRAEDRRVEEHDGRAMRRRGSERGQASIELLLMLPAILLLGLVVWQVHLTLTVANDAENAARTASRAGRRRRAARQALEPQYRDNVTPCKAGETECGIQVAGRSVKIWVDVPIIVPGGSSLGLGLKVHGEAACRGALTWA